MSEPLKPLKVFLFSQNAIPKDFQGIQKESIPNLTNYRPDIIVVFTQEDKRSDITKRIITDIPDYNMKTAKIGSYTLGYQIVMQLYHTLELPNISITMPQVSVYDKITKESITKGGVYGYVNVKGYKPLLFINMHLPISTNKTSQLDIQNNDVYGNKKRIDKMEQVIEDSLQGKDSKNLIMILGGDLNYRKVPDGFEQQNKGSKIIIRNERLAYTDQLDDYLKSNSNKKYNLNELGNLNKFTCKFKTSEEYKDDNLKTCRETSENDGTINEKIDFNNNLWNKCGDLTRFPSACDRFLTNADLTNAETLTVDNYDAAYIEAFKSDHNAIYAALKIEPMSPEEAKKNPLLLSSNIISKGGKKTKKRHNRRKRKNTYRRK